VIRLEVNQLPSGATPKPVRLWWSETAATPADADRLRQAFLRRFDIEHSFRLLKQTLGWTCPKIRTPQAADRWTWLILAVYAQLRLARGLTADLRRPWEKPTPPERLSPARVRRRFRHLRAKTAFLASAPKPSAQAPDDHQADATNSPPNATTCTSAHAPERNRRHHYSPPHVARVKDPVRPSTVRRRLGVALDG
jgi:hypothetical protein